MALQTSIAQYFNNRKRQAVEDSKRSQPPNKLLIVEKTGDDASSLHSSLSHRELGPSQRKTETERKILRPAVPRQPRKTPKPPARSKKEIDPKLVNQQDIRKSLFPQIRREPATVQTNTLNENKDKPDDEVSQALVVPLRVKGTLSPLDRDTPPDRPLHKLDNLKKELGLGEVRAKISRSSRFAQLQDALEKFKQGHDRLGSGTKTVPCPAIKEFMSIQLEVPASPTKTVIEAFKEMRSPGKLREAAFKSPVKTVSQPLPYVSPRKLFEENPPKSPAFQRYYSLVSSGKPALLLPFKFRTLAETFRSVDTVVSIMFNRKETIAFSKLKHSVQELSKKNLTEQHIGQIMGVLPSAFTLSQEKVRQFGSAVKKAKPELVLVPNINANCGGETNSEERMTPSVLLERRRQFFQALLEKTKDYHEEFLRQLDPPMMISREKLMRWHPEFDLEATPDIRPASLPTPPESDKYSTAKDVLNKAREMLMVNPRMEKALERLSENNAGGETASANAIPALASALRGIPKSLLEKVRARQAAKAVEMLTRDPLEAKRDLEMGRLPELARIVRTLFVGEKKSVLPYSVVLNKLTSSYREIITPGEMEEHLKLLMEKVPGWLTHYAFEKQNFLKMAKAMDMGKIMADLNSLSDKNNF